MKRYFGSLCDPTRIILDMHHVHTISVAQHWMQSLRSSHSLRAHSNHIRIIILRSEFKNSINHTSLNRATNHDVSLDLSFATYLHMIFLLDQSRLVGFHIRNHSFFHACNRDEYVFLLGFRTDLCSRSDFGVVLLILAFFTH